MTHPALALLEFSSVAVGIEAGDAMVKRAPVGLTVAGTVHPGHYLVLVAGDVASVEEAVDAGLAAGSDALLDQVVLPDVHPEVVEAIQSARKPTIGEALGVVETRTVAAAIQAADAGRKGADVVVRDLRLADDLGGKAYVLFGGVVSEVEAAVEIGTARVSEAVVGRRVVTQLHREMEENLARSPRFAELIGGGA